MHKIVLSISAICLAVCTGLSAARIGDITTIGGIRDNQLDGFGLVVGLDGKGDNKLDASSRAMVNKLNQAGLRLNIVDIDKAKDFALVNIQATIGPFAKSGDRIDVRVSAIGNATSLQGGTLIQAPLKAANGKIYAVAAGPVSTGGFIGGDDGGAIVQKNHPTSGVIKGGAIVERPINTNVVNRSEVDFKLINPSFTTSVRIADAINRVYPATAQSMNPGTVNVRVPRTFVGQTANFIAALERIEATPDVPARVIINEKNGTIIATEAVTLSPVAINYGSLVIQVANQQQAVQPDAPFGGGETAIVENQQTAVEEQEKTGGFRVVPTKENPSIRDLADALNGLGVTTRDMINILHSLKDSGALHAELIVK